MPDLPITLTTLSDAQKHRLTWFRMLVAAERSLAACEDAADRLAANERDRLEAGKDGGIVPAWMQFAGGNGVVEVQRREEDLAEVLDAERLAWIDVLADAASGR